MINKISMSQVSQNYQQRAVSFDGRTKKKEDKSSETEQPKKPEETDESKDNDKGPQLIGQYDGRPTYFRLRSSDID